MCFARNFWIILFLTCTHLKSSQTYGDNVCTRDHFVTYTEHVYETVSVPYQQKNWFNRYVTKYRTEYQWQPRTRYRLETQYFCCPGYHGSTDNCLPSCDPPCPANSHCSRFGLCICDEGYSGLYCQPVCRDCGKNTYCVAPSLCRCNTGYRQIAEEGECLPQCNLECGDHSFCSAPDHCECEVGYQRVSDNSTCEPVCTSSCGDNSYCKEPENCECRTGYKLAEDGSGQCQPICDLDCGPHSSCFRPGECRCNEGYLLQNGSCQPICSKGCPTNSSCREPDQCECDEGYHEREENLCEPICPKGCSAYARCVSPNECQCFPGYEMSDQTCKPKCSQGCPNGYCFAPEICACSPGHLMGPNNSCEPQCTTTCVQGTCSQPEKCKCEAGYRFAKDSHHICEPICEPNCQNGDCMAPQICICHLGYEPEDPELHNVCKPSCQVSCVNGTCLSPNECSCLSGYVPSFEGNSSICKPNCSKGCPNGLCVAPETCQCYDGFENSSDGCQLPQTTTLDARLEMTTNCTNGCRCWTEITAIDKCVHVCIDEYDKPCLDLDRCHCNQETDNRQLLCDVDGSNETSIFVCQMVVSPKVTPRTDLTSNEAALNSSESPSAAKWPTILVWCVAICILLMSLSAVIRFYLKHRSQQASARRSNELGSLSFENDF